MNDFHKAKTLILHKLFIKNNTFENRSIAQKKVYLLQELGTTLHYFFGWQLHGPFSSAFGDFLADSLDFADIDESMRLTKKTTANIDKVNSLDEKKPCGTMAWYEMLASILFIFRNADSWAAHTDSEVFKALKKQKPRVDKKVFVAALDALRENGFLPSV